MKYEIYIRPWKKGRAKYECIKYPKGYRNLWERISLEEYNKATGKNYQP